MMSVENLERLDAMIEASNRGETLKEISERWGISRQRVSQLLRRAGVDVRANARARRDARRAPRDAEIVELYEAGGLHAEIAQKVGCSKATVTKALSDAGIDGRRNWDSRRRRAADERWEQWAAFYEAGHTQQETAEHFGVHVVTIAARLTEMGVEPHWGGRRR